MQNQRLTRGKPPPSPLLKIKGFSGHWQTLSAATDVPYRGKPASRYRAIGNSMAVPCKWLGIRIQSVNEMSKA
jgi:hypothetical protein